MATATAPTSPRRRLLFGLLALCLIAASALVWRAVSSASTTLPAFDKPLNVLLLGIGGDGHLGGNLADSIMVASLQGNRAVLLSVPRDLYVDIAGLRQGRINAAHAIGEARYDDGIGLLKQSVEDALDIDIHHYVRVDFTGFVQAVDAVGGVEVTLRTPLYDTHFERSFGVIDLPAGTHHLDGREALYVARSRKTSQRGDFSRSDRQRAILLGVRDKLVSLDLLTNPSAIASIYEAAGTHLRSSLSLYDSWHVMRRARLVREIESVGLGDVDGLLTPTTINGAQVLVASDASLGALRRYVHALLST